jgi:hypothetical protein
MVVQKAIIFKGPEDVYGPCGCGLDMAILPVLIPKIWFEDCHPSDAENDSFCSGFDSRRASGMSYGCIHEHTIDNIVYLTNFSCCVQCAERAVQCGYAVWSSEEYPRELR